MADDIALAFAVTVLLGHDAPQCACAEFAVVKGKGVVPLERRRLCQRFAVGTVFAVGVGEAGADFPVRRKCPFDFGFAAKA